MNGWLYALPAAYAVLVWWLGTGAVLLLIGRSASASQRIMLFASALALLALSGAQVSSAQATAAGAYCAFSCGVLVWSWVEISYLFGVVTGPRKTPCPAGCKGARRFWLAIQTSLYHELSIIAVAAAMAWMTHGAPNRIALWTFMILWAMRWSAKLNVFLGVPNLTEEWLPEHLRYLRSYFKNKPINLLFPLSVTAATVGVVLLTKAALGAEAGSFEATGLGLLAAFLALAVIEHWFLVLPIPDAALWHWAHKTDPKPVLPADAPT